MLASTRKTEKHINIGSTKVLIFGSVKKLFSPLLACSKAHCNRISMA